MTTKLAVYNQALLDCKQRKLSALTDDAKGRRLCDQVYDGAIEYCLESGLWKFATRAQRIDYDESFTKQFGYTYQFVKPTDWVKTVAMCSDEYFRVPLIDYDHEAGYWYADIQKIYVRYVSNHTDYGLNLGEWPQTFADYVSAHMADKIVGELTGSDQITGEVSATLKAREVTAKNRDAWNQPQRPPAEGNWVSSRGTGWRGDRGNRSSLTG